MLSLLVPVYEVEMFTLIVFLLVYNLQKHYKSLIMKNNILFDHQAGGVIFSIGKNA